MLVFLILASGFFRAVLTPKDINNYENRPARHLPNLTPAAFLTGEFQEDMESALSDQIPLSQYFKKAYNELSSLYLKHLLVPLMKRHPETVINYNGMRIYQNYMLFSLNSFEKSTPQFDQMIAAYNAAIASNPQVSFSFYYIESDSSYDPISGEKNPVFAYLCNGLNVPNTRIGHLEIDSFTDYCNYFRRTDHHWNHLGSYQGYLSILPLLGVTDAPLIPEEEQIITRNYSGTKSASARLPCFTEDAAVFFFSYPELGIIYGSEDAFRNGTASDSFSYGNFYGGDADETVFDTGKNDRENLLIIGDSYDNAILKLLASHFRQTFALDLRYYNNGNGLNVTEYIRDHRIDRVLVIGSDYLFLDGVYAVRS